jgi:hypothetical protein
MIRLAKINHYDQIGDQYAGIIENHKKEVTDWKDTKFILGPHWELN